jgi:hypothetical protein
MKHIISYSGGLASFFEAKLSIEKYGKENCDLVFCDTNMEDEDLYRFLNDTEKYLGVKIVRLVDGRDVWDMMFEDNFLYNSRVANCSPGLKMRPFNIYRGSLKPRDKSELIKYCAGKYKDNNYVVHLGFDYTEVHRFDKSVKHYLPIKIESLILETELTKQNMKSELAKLGIKLPLLYRLGFAHNNCGGFCVKAGIGHFKQLYKMLPERYIYHMNKEQELIKKIGKEVSILKRVRNGVKINLTLKDLKEEFDENNMQLSFDEEFDIGGCNCFVN